MNNKWCCSRERLRRAIEMKRAAGFLLALLTCGIGAMQRASAADAPAWMHSLVNAPLPAHDEKTDVVLLYSERTVTVLSVDKMKITVREAYKILRPSGRQYGVVGASFDSRSKITGMRAWCIPAQGKDYEVKDKEAIDISLPNIEGSELVSDVKDKMIRIPAAEPGNLLGYEYEEEKQTMVLEDVWDFQETNPVRESHYTLQLPQGWEYKATWINYPEIKPTQSGNQVQWVIGDVKAIKVEDRMPPWDGIAGLLVVSFVPPGGAGMKAFRNWKEMGDWEAGLEQGRRDASAEIKQKVAALTSSTSTQLDKMRALAKFVQGDVRYVAIELGIGGWQPHPAPEIFAHRYGDCKDKATLMGSMLNEIGIESYYVSVNTVRGGAATDRPPMVNWFNHEILAVRLPENLKDPSLVAVIDHPKLGRILIFDPTDEYTPFGRLRGALQANYGLLVTPDGGELVQLPQLPTATSGIERVAKMTLDAQGTLRGDVVETRLGDAGWVQRLQLKAATQTSDQLKRLESIVAHSFATFQITKGSILNLNQTDQPFGYYYSLVAQSYAKNAGNLLLVRPRVLGSHSSDILETKEPRQYPVEMLGPEKNTDTFEIKLPAGYEVDDLPPPVNADYSFASYHSKTEVNGDTLKYTRTFEVKELSVPVTKTEELKKLYRIIAGDERNTAVLKPKGS
jgi:hypothetical protein